MKIYFSLILCALALTLGSFGCGSPAANNAASPPASADTAKATTNTNGAANIDTSNKLEGETVKNDEAGLQMIVPKTFKSAKDGQETVYKTADDGVSIRIAVPKDGTYEATVANAAKEIGTYLTDVKVNATAKDRTLNGMGTTEMTGTGKTKDGKAVTWNATVVNAPKRPVILAVYGQKDEFEKSQTDIKRFLDNVKKQ
jgi:hypothetical protein